MQSLSAKGLEGRLRLGPQPGGLALEAGPIGGISEKGMPYMGQVHPDLVGASGFQGACNKARDRFAVGPRIAVQHLPVSDGRSSSTLSYALLFPGAGVASNRCVYRAFLPVWCAPNEGEVASLKRPTSLLRELLREYTMSLVGLGCNHQACRVLVESMHDARPFDPADPRERCAAMGDQCID